jgi:hypothetical protein
MTANRRFKNFGSGEDVVKDPLSFSLHGEDFECHPSIQGRVLLGIVAKTSSDDQGAAIAEVIEEFFAVCLLPESFKRFNALLDDPEKIVSVETLGDITAWLVEEYSARPTQPPGLSSSGQ